MYKPKKLDKSAAEAARRRWASIAKPLHGLGEFEDIIIQLAAVSGTAEVDIKKRTLVVVCADNGVVKEGVTQTGQNVTKTVAENFLKGETSACKMASATGFDLLVCDAGVVGGQPEGVHPIAGGNGAHRLSGPDHMDRHGASPRKSLFSRGGEYEPGEEKREAGPA